MADIGGGKSFCIPWDRWTNCREVGRCVYETYRDEAEDAQTSILDLLKEEK